MSTADKATRIAAAAAVLVVATIAAVISYGHAYELVRTHGEHGWTARALPLTVDGLIVTCSLVLLDAARRDQRAPFMAWVLLGTGIVATLGANVAHGLAHGAVGAVVSGWPALVAVGSFEMLSRLIRGGRPADEHAATDQVHEAVAVPELAPIWQPWPIEAARAQHDPEPDVLDPEASTYEPDPLQVQASEIFAENLANGEVPSIRQLKKQLRIGQPKAREVKAHLSELVNA